MNSYQITDIGGTNVRVDRKTQSAIYFSTQDNAVWASTDGGETWPRNDCCEGFHIEVAHTAETDEKVTVGYGKVGAGPQPDHVRRCRIRESAGGARCRRIGSNAQGWSPAFYLKPKNWLRLRMPPVVDGQPAEPNEIRVSDNNGAKWRLRYTTTLRWAGPVPADEHQLSQLRPIGRIGRSLPASPNGVDTRGKIGLVGLFGPTANAVTTIGDSQIIRLPNDGSLGLRATEFDWQAVFAVDPRDWLLMIAPDIRNQRMMITRSAGLLWQENTQLTNLVLESGNLLMYKHPYHMQVTHIGFDPYDENRILVGTRDAGIMQSVDRGETWSKIRRIRARALRDRILLPTEFGCHRFDLWSRVVPPFLGGWMHDTAAWANSRAHQARFRGRGDRKGAGGAGHRAREEDDRMPDGFDDPKLARISLSTDLPTIGVPAVGEAETIGLTGKGFDPAGPPVVVLLDGRTGG